MAKVHICPSGIYAISGTAGDFVYKRHRGETIMGRRPDMSGVVQSERQVANCSHFAKAVRYAKAAKTEAIYQEIARKKKRCAYHVALSDFRKPPVVDDIDLSDYAGAPGDVIPIRAYDNVHVAGVSVRLTDGDGAVLEEGEADQLDGSRWLYTTTLSISSASTVRVEATARDLPGGTHTAVREFQVAGAPGEDSVVLQAASAESEDSGVLEAVPAESEISVVLQAAPAESEVSVVLQAAPAEGEVREACEPRRRRLQSPQVRRARRRGQRRLPSPEVWQDDEAEPVPSLEAPRDDAPALVLLKCPRAVGTQNPLIEAAPTPGDVESIPGGIELLQQSRVHTPSMGDRPPEHVGLALDLPLPAGRLLATPAREAGGRADHAGRHLDRRHTLPRHDGGRSLSPGGRIKRRRARTDLRRGARHLSERMVMVGLLVGRGPQGRIASPRSGARRRSGAETISRRQVDRLQPSPPLRLRQRSLSGVQGGLHANVTRGPRAP